MRSRFFSGFLLALYQFLFIHLHIVILLSIYENIVHVCPVPASAFIRSSSVRGYPVWWGMEEVVGDVG